LETLLSQRREARAAAALKMAAQALASDAGACGEVKELAAEFLMAENEALARAEAPQPQSGGGGRQGAAGGDPSADALTEAGLATLLVVPLTTQRRRGAEALRVLIPPRDRLRRECWAMADQPRALDRNRIGAGPLTRLNAAEMQALEQA
jgi:hypothetical protein